MLLLRRSGNISSILRQRSPISATTPNGNFVATASYG